MIWRGRSDEGSNGRYGDTMLVFAGKSDILSKKSVAVWASATG